MTGGTEGLSDQFQALRLFVQVARTGSFSKGARAMRLSQPTASRIIALLEEQLRTSLFSRSTRALILTDAGAAYLARIQPILASLEEADNAIRGGEDLHGSLRIGVSTILASRALVPLLGGFLTRHPNLQVELVTDDRRQDLIQEGIDVAVRIGRLPDSSAIARLVGRWPLVVAAAPSYLEREGTSVGTAIDATASLIFSWLAASGHAAFATREPRRLSATTVSRSSGASALPARPTPIM